MIKLLIDTKDSSNISATIECDGKTFVEVSKTENKRPESILNLVERVCKKAKIDTSQIDEIFVYEGPGSFTGLKVGVSVANALSFALGKKVNGRVLGELVEPKYE